MQKILIILIFIFIGSMCWKKNSSYPDGFREAKCGAKLESFKDMKKKEIDSKYYYMASDVLKIKDVELSNIRYAFENGKLTSIFIILKNKSDSGEVYEMMSQQYGTVFILGNDNSITWEYPIMDILYNRNDGFILYFCKDIYQPSPSPGPGF